MKVCVLNGSPRGGDSVTLKYVQYLEKESPGDSFYYVNVAEKFKNYESDEEEVLSLIERIMDVDLILVAFPVYSMCVPYQLMRFFEILRDHRISPRISNIHFTWISTSKKFFDNYAHKYIKSMGIDMGMRVLDGFSAIDMDFYYEDSREELLEFWRMVSTMVMDNIGGSTNIKVQMRLPYHYFPDFKIYDTHKESTYDTLILTDANDEDIGLRNMINVFNAFYPNRTREINVTRFNFVNGCIGCKNCVKGNDCVLDDGFLDFYQREIERADAIIYAGTMKYGYLRTIWKCFEDRLFCKGLRANESKAVGYIFAQTSHDKENLMDIYTARSEVLGNYFVNIITDESKDAAVIGDNLQHLAKEMDYALARSLHRSPGFVGRGARTLLRDMVYVNRGYMTREHRFAKKFGMYDDLPTNQTRQIMQMYKYGMANNVPNKSGSSYLERMMLKDYARIISRGE